MVANLGVRYTRGCVWTHRIHVNPHSVWIHSGYTVRYTASGFEDEHVFFAVSERGIRLRSPSPMPLRRPAAAHLMGTPGSAAGEHVRWLRECKAHRRVQGPAIIARFSTLAVGAAICYIEIGPPTLST